MVEMPKFVGPYSVTCQSLKFSNLCHYNLLSLSILASFSNFFQSFMDQVHESIGSESISLGYDLIPWSECVNLYVQT
jgi:hypothetical protein